MKTAKILNHNIWIINTLRAYGSLTFEEIRKKWQEDNMSDGNALARSSFNRYRDAITKIFGIVIECDLETYKYYISNPNRISIFNNPRLFGYNPALLKCAAPYENSKIPAKVWRLQKNFVLLHTASIRCRYICPIATRIGTNL